MFTVEYIEALLEETVQKKENTDLLRKRKRENFVSLRIFRKSIQNLNSGLETCLSDRSFVWVAVAYLHLNKRCDVADIQC
jgi:hypothetical protein